MFPYFLSTSMEKSNQTITEIPIIDFLTLAVTIIIPLLSALYYFLHHSTSFTINFNDPKLIREIVGYDHTEKKHVKQNIESFEIRNLTPVVVSFQITNYSSNDLDIISLFFTNENGDRIPAMSFPSETFLTPGKIDIEDDNGIPFRFDAKDSSTYFIPGRRSILFHDIIAIPNNIEQLKVEVGYVNYSAWSKLLTIAKPIRANVFKQKSFKYEFTTDLDLLLKRSKS